jgi:hypothetical protein
MSEPILGADAGAPYLGTCNYHLDEQYAPSALFNEIRKVVAPVAAEMP